MVELVTDRLVIATPGERHIDEVFRIGTLANFRGIM